MTDREELLRCLRILTYREWPELPGEWLSPERKDQELNAAHVNAIRKIGIQLISDPEAAAFVQRVNDSIPEPYTTSETLAAAKELAAPFLARLVREEQKGQAESGYVKYTRGRADYDPFIADANVCIDGLYEPAKLKTRFDRESGAIETQEDERPVPCIGRPSAKRGDEVLVHSRR